MKKYLFIACLLLISASIVNADDEAFYRALQGCTQYSGEGQSKTEGSIVKYHSQILGWQNDKCVYKENVSFSGINSCTICKLSQKQIDELVNVMRAYSTVQKYSVDEPDLSKIENVQNNPIVRVWNKYLTDSSVCTIELSK